MSVTLDLLVLEWLDRLPLDWLDSLELDVLEELKEDQATLEDDVLLLLDVELLDIEPEKLLLDSLS